MELNDGNLQTLAGYLQKTLSPDVVERRAGTAHFMWLVKIARVNFPAFVAIQNHGNVYPAGFFQRRSFWSQLRPVRTTLFCCCIWLIKPMPALTSVSAPASCLRTMWSVTGELWVKCTVNCSQSVVARIWTAVVSWVTCLPGTQTPLGSSHFCRLRMLATRSMRTTGTPSSTPL